MKGLSLITLLLILSLFMSSCTFTEDDQPIYLKYDGNLFRARESFSTVLTVHKTDGNNLTAPPEDVLEVVEYQSPAGNLSAYITPDPMDGQKHPAIIWIAGEFSNTPDSMAWKGPSLVFIEKGIVTMYPSFRGGGSNPGYIECLYGEVDDLIAAVNYLSRLPYVDSERIYLGGHSSGGTLALLAAESDDNLLRAVFAFGPVGKIEQYNIDFPFDVTNDNELAVRSPIRWLDSIQCKTFVIEGMVWGNMEALSSLRATNKNDNITFYAIQGYDHVNVLLPGCNIIAKKILSDTDSQCNIDLNINEFKQ